MATLYYAVQFVTLHQENPGFNPGNNDGNPLLDIGGIATSKRQYSLEPGYGDPGQPGDSFDFPEWSVSFATFVRPADYSTAKGTYECEAYGGGNRTVEYLIWRTMTVPDDFVLPGEYLAPSGSDWWDAFRSDAIATLGTAAQAFGIPGAEIAGILNTSVGLSNALNTHMTRQFDLIQQVTSGAISVDEFLALSDVASQGLVIDLAGTPAGSSALIATLAKQLVSRHVVASDPSHNLYDTEIGFGSNAGFFPPDLIRFEVVGSPSHDEIVEGWPDGSVVAAGLGDDWVYATEGSGILVGGGGIDTIDYSGIADDGIEVSLVNGTATGTGFVDRIAGFENVVGTWHDDALVGDGGANVLHGGAGADVLNGGGGQDILDGGSGNDLYVLGNASSGPLVILDSEGIDTISTTIGRDIALFVTIENLVLEGPGAVRGFGNDLDNTIIGNALNNYLDGRGGSDTLIGGDGNDSYQLGGSPTGIDTLIDSSGIDTIFSTIDRSLMPWSFIENLILEGPGSITGSGNNADNGIQGNKGSNLLYGQGGIDTILGGDGNDFIFGQGHRDLLHGEGGDDTFVYQTATDSSVGAGSDVIFNFDRNGNDVIDLSRLPGTLGFIGTGGFGTANRVRINDVAGPDLVIEINLVGDATPEMQIYLVNTSIAQIGIDDFIL